MASRIPPAPSPRWRRCRSSCATIACSSRPTSRNSAAQETAMSHRVRLQRGECFEAAPDETVLQGALRSGVALAHDCQLGGCGTCRARLIEGTITYEEWPFALTEEEAAEGFALMRQARPQSDLVIEPTSSPGAWTAPAS